MPHELYADAVASPFARLSRRAARPPWQYDHGVGVPDEPAVGMPDDVSPGGNVRWLAPECLGGIGIERGVPGLAHARRQSQPRTRPHDDS